MNKQLSDINLLLKARWENPRKYSRKIIVTNHGLSHYSIGFDKTEQQLLSEIRKDYNLNEFNEPIPSRFESLKQRVLIFFNFTK